jgi:hypothetical protein
LALLAHVQAIEDMNRRHVQEAQALQGKAIQRLKALDLDRLSPADVLRYCIESAKLERAALGEPQGVAATPLSSQGGATVPFTLEDAVRADQELEELHRARMQHPGSPPLPEGSPQVP